MATLQERLDEFKKAFESGAPPYNAPHEAIEKMHRATAELCYRPSPNWRFARVRRGPPAKFGYRYKTRGRTHLQDAVAQQ
jgi:hypothetical protein